MKFGNTLAESLIPEWRAQYINYDALKHKLKQARDTSDDFLEASQPPITSFSIPRSISQTPTALLQHLQQQQLDHDDVHRTGSSQQQHLQDSAELLQQQEGQQQLHRRVGSSPGLRVPEALQLDGGPTEQFLQLLQQELNKVRDFITAQGSSLQDELRMLAAAAPQLSLQDCQQLEAQANELGRQLLALEAYMQLNQAGFVKICKKHDKWLPESPIWHLYLHHLQRSPWLDDSSRQYMWAALSSCYYHLHAASIYTSRERQQQQRQQQQQPRPSPRGDGTNAGEQQQGMAGASAAARARAAAASSSRKVVGGLTSALGSAVAGAANAVAGAASAVAGASAAAIAAAAAAGGPPTLSVPGSAQAVSSQDTSGVETVKITKKFWVRESDVPAVMYYILQHLPLLPSTSHATAAVTGTEQGGAGISKELGSGQQKRQSSCASSLRSQPDSQQQQQQWSGSGSSHVQPQQPQLLLQPALGGFTTSLHTVYFDNAALQLYHGRLYLRPQAQTLKARWIGQAQGAEGSEAVGFGAEGWCPEKVVLERKIYREGWRGEPNTKDSLLIAGDKLPEYLAGAYTLGDALADLCEVPALKAQLLSASSSVRRRQQQQQQPPGGCAAQRALLDSPFAQAAAAAVAAGSVSGHAAGQQNGVAIPAGAGAGAGAAAEAVADAEEDEAAAALAASVRVPRGFAIGSFSSKSLGQPGGSGSHPSLLQLLEREQQQQQQQLSRGRSRGPEADTAAAAAAGIEDDLQAGFADAYLDPPVPTADQLSLFTEVQRIVGRRRLRPVLHCKLHRMVFAMPFDDRIRITLDTDVQTMALDQALPTAAAQWHQQQHHRRLSVLSMRSDSGAIPAETSTDHSIPPAAASGGAVANSSPVPPLPPRAPSSSGGGNATAATGSAELQASYAAWESVFNPQALRQPSSPAYGHSNSNDGGSKGSAAVYPMPYALLKVSCKLPANQSIPGWLQQLMESEATVPIEDWSKFIHGCAVLLPETVRAVPYWMDDELVELSVAALQGQLDAEEARREQLRLQLLQQHVKRNSSAGSFSAGAPGSSGGGAEGSLVDGTQQQQPMLQRLSGSFRAVLNRTSSGGPSGRGLQHGNSSSGGGSLAGVQHMLLLEHLRQPQVFQQQQQGYQEGSGQGAGADVSHRRQSRLRVSTPSAAAGQQRVSWADGGPYSSSSTAGTPTHPEAAAAALAASVSAATGGRGYGVLHKLWRLVRKDRPPPLFRPEFSSARRPRRYNPVQLLESREYLYSESVFLHWLHLAITLASVAVLLMGYSSMAYVNPLKRPAMHVAEIICLLMLPASCIISGYAIRSYVWRSKRLHSMRYSRVDDEVGPLVMALVFVASMSAVMLVNIADILMLLRAGDDSGGGDDPDSGDTPEAVYARAAAAPAAAVKVAEGVMQALYR